MSVEVRITGDKHLDLADELQEDAMAPAKAAVGAAADILLAESRRLITRFGKGPAPAGETPGTLTGNLLKKTKKLAPRVKPRGAMAWSGVQYAPHSWLLEYGHLAPDGTRVLPRPFVRQAVANTEGPIDALLRERMS